MKSKDKAKELVDKFQFILTEKQFGKQCALIAVDEVIDNIEDDYMHYELDWWQEVKQEINKL